MKIAVLSDSHDHIWNLNKILSQIKSKVGAIIHCGDVIAPFTIKLIAYANLPTYVVLGNNDEDHIGMYKKGTEKFTWITVGEQFGEVELEGRKIAFTHYPKLGELLAGSREYDAVFHGHTHVVRNEAFGKTTLVNPGSVCGIIKGKTATASYAIYDTDSNSAQIINL